MLLSGPHGLVSGIPRASHQPCARSLQPGLLQQRGFQFGSTHLGLRHGGHVILREAASTEILETVKVEKVTVVGGDGASSLDGSPLSRANGTRNGNGHLNGNGNGAAHAETVTVALNGNGSSNGQWYSSNGTNGKATLNGSTAANANRNGSASAKPSTSFDAMSSLEMASDPAVAGQIETVAATAQNQAIAEAAAAAKAAAEKRAKRSATGTPYKAPSSRWSNIKGYSTFRRTTEIWFFALQFAIKYFLVNQKWTYGKEGMTKEAVSERKKTLAVWLREGLVRLGPTFIKIGQQFSTRVDVLSPEFIKELEKLQDRVPSFDSDTAIEILESSLGRPVSSVFDEFETEPLAAASLGQVHRAVIKGQQVVVKIQRPGLKDLFDIDCKNIRALAVWLQKTDPKTDGAARDWVAIYDECSRILYQEIDYELEGKNADRFRENFKGVSWVKVPNVLWEYSSAEVLVLEYVPGTKINDAEAIDRMGLDRSKLARYAVESYLQQILRHGFFHADPHPGNVAVDAMNGGRLIYYDFGMIGSIPPRVRGGLLDLFYGVYNRDPDRCLEALTAMGVYVPTGDRTAVRRTAEFFLSAFQERLNDQRKEREAKGDEYNKTFKEQRSKEEGKAVRKRILTSIGEDLLVAANDQPFRFPATFTFVVRAFSVLDGIGKSLDPRFDISEIAAPYARELLLESGGNSAVDRVKADLAKRAANQNRAVVNLFRAPNKIEDVANLLQKLERGDLKLRVRALEAERALTRVQLMQRVIASALAASTLVNMGTVLWVSALSGASAAAFVGAAVFALLTLKNFVKVAQLEKKELQLAGAV